MLNKTKHQLVMGQILKDIYTDVSLSSLLGFKGGTCSYFFYQLPRFSVDLDFDLLNITAENQQLVFEKVTTILSKYGQVKDQFIKKFTIFVLLSYGEDEHNIKIEINTRSLLSNCRDYFQIRELFGISLLVAKKEYLFAGKLAALTARREVAIRDIYDIHYYAKSHWDIEKKVVESICQKSLAAQLVECVALIERVTDNQILHGLGELVDGAKEKAWIKKHLRSETIFLLRQYLAVTSGKLS